MARNTKIVKIDRRGARCTLVTYRGGGEKGQLEIPGGMPAFRDWINETIKDNHELLVALALKQWLAKNPGSTDFSAIEGKTITLDFEAAATAGIVTVTA
jgi:hypothetical protein